VLQPYNAVLFSKKRNEVLINVAIWMNLRNILLSERSQTQESQETTYYIKCPKEATHTNRK
jgi:hypothetical protein